jgi:hypothetical protein
MFEGAFPPVGTTNDAEEQPGHPAITHLGTRYRTHCRSKASWSATHQEASIRGSWQNGWLGKPGRKTWRCGQLQSSEGGGGTALFIIIVRAAKWRSVTACLQPSCVPNWHQSPTTWRSNEVPEGLNMRNVRPRIQSPSLQRQWKERRRMITDHIWCLTPPHPAWLWRCNEW